MVATAIGGISICLVAGANASPSDTPIGFVEDGPVQFVDGIATAQVYNTTNHPQRLSFSLTWSDLEADGGGSIRASAAFTVTPPEQITAGGQLSVVVSRVEEVNLEPGAYHGTLRVFTGATARDAVALDLIVDEPAADVVPIPLVDSWTVRSQRDTWWAAYTDRNAQIPIQAGATAYADETYVTTISGTGGSSLKVMGRVVDDGVEPYFKLTFEPGTNGAPSGTYEGTLDLTPDSEGDEVTLTVERRDGLGIPFLVLAASLLLGWLIQQFLWPGLALGRLAGRADTVRESIDPAASIGGLTLTGFDEFDRKAGQYRSDLLFRFDPVRTDGEEMQQADADVVTLEDAAKIWSPDAIGVRASELTKALNDLKAARRPRPPGAEPEVPAFITKAETLLTGEVAVTELSERSSRIDDAAALTETWPGLWDQATSFKALLSELDERRPLMDASDLRLFERARRLQSGALWDLWHATDSTDLATRATSSELEEADTAVGELIHWLSVRVEETEDGPSAVAASGQPAVTAVPISGIVPPIIELARKALQWGRSASGKRFRVNLLTGAVVVLAYFVSLWGGLVNLYFDSAFGTPRDYVGLVVWALGTSATLGFINEVFGKQAVAEVEATTEEAANEQAA